MSCFRLKLFARVVRLSLSAPADARAGFARKRLRFFFLDLPVLLVIEIVNWTCLMLDEIFFRAYRREQIEAPLFVVGPPRSGTTFLHRLLHEDPSFTSFSLWEILLAPSVLQKKLFLLMGRLDQRRGGRFHRHIVRREQQFLSDAMHQTSLFAPEEDEMLLLHNFSSGHFLIFVFPYEKEMSQLIYFDRKLPEPERNRIMRYYKTCVKRHMYVFGKGKRFLSKNPGFSTKIHSLAENFPEAAFIFLARNPLQSIPSTLSLFSHAHSKFPTSNHPGRLTDFILEQMRTYYLYPLNAFREIPENRKVVVSYNDLVHDPEQTIQRIYSRLQMLVTPHYQKTLEKEKQKAATFKSEHDYSPEKFGLSQEDILIRFKDVFDRLRLEGVPVQDVHPSQPSRSAPLRNLSDH